MTSGERAGRGGARAGFTVVEMLTVLVIFGLIAGVGFGALRRASAAASLAGALETTSALVARAHAAALQRGAPSRFVRTANRVVVTVDSGGTQVPLGSTRDLFADYGVTVTATRDTIAFDQRGLAVGLGAVERLVVVKGALTDSVCITALGKVLPRGCAL